MGAALGFALGAGLGLAGNTAKAKVQREQQHDELMLSMYQRNPELATTQSGQEFLKKKYGKDTAEMFMTLGSHAATFRQQMMQPEQAGPAGPTQISGDPIQQHIDALNSRIQHYQGLLARAPSESPEHVPFLQSAIKELTDQRDRFMTEQGQQMRDIRTEERQEKHEAEAEKRMQESFAQQDKRLAAMQEHSERLETMREDFRDHLEDLKGAKDAKARAEVFTRLQASLSKQATDLASKLNKGSDYDQQARRSEVDAFNQHIDALAQMADSPEQADALSKLKLSVAAATPGRIFGETPGAVGGATAMPTATNAKGEKIQFNGKEWVPVGK